MSEDRKSSPDSTFVFNEHPGGAQVHGMIGASAPMRALFGALPRIATASAPLLIGGERGTGKDLFARAVHDVSGRAGGPYLTVDCRAAPESQLRALLFGHAGQPFGAAARREAGALRSADGGTLVLKGIGGLSPDLQSQLFRILRTGEAEFPREGLRQIDVRIVATADTELETAVENGQFDEALYYKLNVLGIKVPPLRERGRDVQLLADYFLGKFTTPGSRRRVVGFSAEARLAMQQWGWPGNVRELVNRVKKAIVMCERGPLYSSDLDLDGRTQGRLAMTLDEARDAAELSALLTALAATNGDLRTAAAKLEISRTALCRLMLKHRIDVASPQLIVDSDR